jgi:hypothetical protein
MKKPMAFAVLRLIANSNLVGCSTERSAGAAPFKFFPVARPNAMFGNEPNKRHAPNQRT